MNARTQVFTHAKTGPFAWIILVDTTAHVHQGMSRWSKIKQRDWASSVKVSSRVHWQHSRDIQAHFCFAIINCFAKSEWPALYENKSRVLQPTSVLFKQVPVKDFLFNIRNPVTLTLHNNFKWNMFLKALFCIITTFGIFCQCLSL